jgi:hypothetical protein
MASVMASGGGVGTRLIDDLEGLFDGADDGHPETTSALIGSCRSTPRRPVTAHGLWQARTNRVILPCPDVSRVPAHRPPAAGSDAPDGNDTGFEEIIRFRVGLSDQTDDSHEVVNDGTCHCW